MIIAPNLDILKHTKLAIPSQVFPPLQNTTNFLVLKYVVFKGQSEKHRILVSEPTQKLCNKVQYSV